MCDQTERDFKGIWIPKEIYLDSNLSAIEKMIYVELDSLNGEKGCFATNQYIADFCQCSPRTVTSAITHLAELGYITVELTDNTKRIIRTTLANFARGVSKNCEGGSQNLRHSNTKENNKEIEKDTTNVVSKKKDGKVDIPTDAFEDADIQAKFEEWCSYRRAIHKSLKTQRGINGAIKTIREGIAKYGKQTVLESIDRCMEAEYQGLFIKPDNKGGNYRGISSAFSRPYSEADYENYDEGDSL